MQTFPGSCLFVAGNDTLRPGVDYLVDPASAGVRSQNYEVVYCNSATLYRSVNAFKPCPKDRILVVSTTGYGADTNKVLQTRLREALLPAAIVSGLMRGGI